MEKALEKYRRGLEFLYNKYSFSTGIYQKNFDSFKDLTKSFQTIAIADLIRICKDFDIQDLISKEEVLILKLFISKKKKSLS
jgi:hypothetical protein